MTISFTDDADRNTIQLDQTAGLQNDTDGTDTDITYSSALLLALKARVALTFDG